MTQEEQILKKLEDHESGPIPVELIVQIITLIPSIIELVSRKALRKQVEVQGKLIQILMQTNLEHDARLKALEPTI